MSLILQVHSKLSMIFLSIPCSIPHLVSITHLLPTGSEERGMLGVGSIPVAMLPSCQDMNYCIIIA